MPVDSEPVDSEPVVSVPVVSVGVQCGFPFTVLPLPLLLHTELVDVSLCVALSCSVLVIVLSPLGVALATPVMKGVTMRPVPREIDKKAEPTRDRVFRGYMCIPPRRQTLHR